MAAVRGDLHRAFANQDQAQISPVLAFVLCEIVDEQRHVFPSLFPAHVEEKMLEPVLGNEALRV